MMRRLGNTGLELNPFGMGGIPIQRVTQEDANLIVETFYNQGGRFIDTARGYAKSESLIGNAIKAYNRSEWVIATKSPAKTYEAMKQDIEISLNQLSTDYIDLYQCHLVKTIDEYNQIMSEDGAYKALFEAKEKGIIRHIGITAHNAQFLESVLDQMTFETIQFPYNCVERQGENLFKRAHAKGLGVIVMKPLAGGAIEAYDLSLRFVLENSAVSIVIPGMDNPTQVIQNAEVIKQSTPLSELEASELKSLSEAMGTRFCRRCGYCMPCPQGIDIPTQFLMEGYLTRYGLEAWARERYTNLSIKADACVKCGLCEPRCPYELPIIDMLGNVVSKFK